VVERNGLVANWDDHQNHTWSEQLANVYLQQTFTEPHNV